MDELVAAVLTASRVLVGVAARSLADVEDAVTVTQFRALVVLSTHGPVNLNGLAELLDVNASSALRLTDRLLVADLVVRGEHPDNRREILLELSEHGHRLVRSVTERRQREIRRIVRRMSGESAEGMVSALRAFADAAAEKTIPDSTALGW